MPLWTWLAPLIALAVMIAALFLRMTPIVTALAGLALVAAVVAAVHHAEVIARRVGEPLGTLLLSIAVTVIEVALIVSMVSAGPHNATLARDTIYCVMMITCNGLVGLCLLIGAIRHGEQSFQVMGANAILATLIALTTLALVLPTFTVSSPGPTYTKSQLIFAGTTSLVLWGMAVLFQTGRHRHYFLPTHDGANDDRPEEKPALRLSVISAALLLASLAGVVGLAHAISGPMEVAVARAGAPSIVMSIGIATLTLLPEGVAALRAALNDRLQISLNLALGSALASIGLTIPAVGFTSLLIHTPMTFGLAPKELLLVAVTFVVASITFVAGRSHGLQGIVHLVLFGAFLFFSFVP
jgi:Ca2+:H+ antiporter